MGKHFECLSCGAKMTGSEGVNPGNLVDESGMPVGCPMCGATNYKPLLDQMEPEE